MVLGADLANKGLRGKVVIRNKLSFPAKKPSSPPYVFRIASWVGSYAKLPRINAKENTVHLGR